jgi:hypothetical protein
MVKKKCYYLVKGHTNPEHQVSWVTEFHNVVSNIIRYLVWNVLNVILVAPRILRRCLNF